MERMLDRIRRSADPQWTESVNATRTPACRVPSRAVPGTLPDVALTVIFASILAVFGFGLIAAAVRPRSAVPVAPAPARIDWVALNAWTAPSGAVAAIFNAGGREPDHRDRQAHAHERESQWRALVLATNTVTLELPVYRAPVGRHRRQEAA